MSDGSPRDGGRRIHIRYTDEHHCNPESKERDQISIFEGLVDFYEKHDGVAGWLLPWCIDLLFGSSYSNEITAESKNLCMWRPTMEFCDAYFMGLPDHQEVKETYLQIKLVSSRRPNVLKDMRSDEQRREGIGVIELEPKQFIRWACASRDYNRLYSFPDPIVRWESSEQSEKTARFLSNSNGQSDQGRTLDQPKESAGPWGPSACRRHSSDFRSVLWDGEVHEFTEKQAQVVEILWHEAENGTSLVGEATLLNALDPDGEHKYVTLKGVFDKGKHLAWGTMIVPGGRKGTLRLSEFQKNYKSPR